MVRRAFIIVYAFLIITLLLCGVISWRSKKAIGRSVSIFCLSLIPPVLGNMIIIGATTTLPALIGCYIYYIGMDLIMQTLIMFTNRYCYAPKEMATERHQVPSWIRFFLLFDVIQMLMNPFLGHAFALREIEVYGAPYFIMEPLIGQTFHRIVCYGALLFIMFVFVSRTIKVPKIYKERYAVILISMIIGTLWQTFYIFSRTPIDRSMIGFAVFGILIFYFSIYYRPVRLLDSILARMASSTKEGVFLYGPEGRCLWVNSYGLELTKAPLDDYEHAARMIADLFGDVLSVQGDIEYERSIVSGIDEQFFTVTKGDFFDDNQKLLGTFLRIKDITEEKMRLDRELFMANHDALTRVYNREYCLKKISDKLRQHSLGDYYIAAINLCDFKVFNDAFGRDFGDAALIQVAEWMKRYSDESCIYGRIGGDMFGSCLPKAMFDQAIVEKDLTDFSVKWGDAEHHLEVHVGFCSIDEGDEDVSVLFDRAMMALDSIRDNYKKHVAFFDSKIRDKMLWNKEISGELQTAIDKGQICPYFQPIADRDGKIVGAEALARWIHPVYGFMSPAEFIPLFEENGMIADLDRHIWKSACKTLADWEKKYPDLFISVNVSPKDFFMSDVLSDIMSYVLEYDIDPGKLRIEVTETSMMRDTDYRIKVLEEFRKQGFIVEMDDFGSGYSSLNMLKDMPVDVLKIDMKFLSKTSDERKADIIVKNVIRLSDDLDITSLAEGVETEKHFNKLNEFGCTLFQGYYFSKPLPIEEFEAMLKE